MATEQKVPIPEIPSVSADVTGVRSTSRITHKEKSLFDTYILSIVPIFGLFGAHHFYLGRTWFGVAYFLTVGLFGVGYVVDIFRTPCLVREYNLKVRKGESPTSAKRTVGDAYVMWFPCGLFGAHHFFLRNYKLGILYFFTVGLFGVGWLVDFFRMPRIVKQSNTEIADDVDIPEEKSVLLAYAFAVPPLGLLGAHHFYLNRPGWGFAYSMTAGFFGLGMVFDWFRMPVLVARANGTLREPEIFEDAFGNKVTERFIDDLFVTWLPPLGLLGAHHFYLRRYFWGFMYMFTCGGLGVGWLIDAFRLPQLLQTHTRIVGEQRKILDHVNNTYVSTNQQNGDTTAVVMTPPPEVAQPMAANPHPGVYQGPVPGIPPPYPSAPPQGYPQGYYPVAPPPYSAALGHAQLYPVLNEGPPGKI